MFNKKIILILCGVLVVGALATIAMNNDEVSIAKQQSAVITTDATQAQAESAINDTKTSNIVVDSNTVAVKNNQLKDTVSNKAIENQNQALDIVNSTQNTASTSSNNSNTQSEDQTNELVESTKNL